MRELGLIDLAKKSRRKVTVQGVLPGVNEQWILIEVKLRIKGRVFTVDAAIGGTTSLLVSHTDVIARLMKEDGYVIGVPGTTPIGNTDKNRFKAADQQQQPKTPIDKRQPKTASKTPEGLKEKIAEAKFWLGLGLSGLGLGGLGLTLRDLLDT